LEEIVDLA
jgi:hypothetical protein